METLRNMFPLVSLYFRSSLQGYEMLLNDVCYFARAQLTGGGFLTKFQVGGAAHSFKM